MGTRSTSVPKYTGIILATALLIPASSAIAQSNNSKSQVVYLPDPTPRQRDLEKVYGDTSQTGTRTQETLEVHNAKRRELVEWAADELVTLSEQLAEQVTVPKSSTSAAAATANAEKIEKLAKNLTAALKAP